MHQAVTSVQGVAWVQNSNILAAFEDVSRHSALDKLIGHGIREGYDWQQGFTLISSHAGYKMVAKAAAMDIGGFAAVSSPTELAVRLAEQAGMALIGFVREQRFTVYTYPQYIVK
ncbi:formate dehydrogenase accessory sulfurtransferase FdhD [Neisseria iguanae]|uniref:Formate dehydrogenase accessory protein n=1 Tax=Neisseria iguanae TaxID=90242 RepID=A0A2P7TXC1_9NEIS|nr:formate dehydrogenase accessory sulfurtransferase FdhD [Neisseria iguanae]PSJ79354.1 formate dehydrogenase accessory protein [Neisseria iguanae]